MTNAYASVWDAIEKTAGDAAHMQVRGALLVDLQKRMRATGDSQAALAKRLGVTRPRASDVVRGRIDLMSVDMLIDLLAKLGVAVHVRTRKLSPPANSRPAANMVGKRKKTVSPRAQTNAARAVSRNKQREALEDARDIAEARARSAKPVGKPVPLRVVAAKLGVKLGKTGRRVGKAR